MTSAEYIALITSEHADKSRFVATLEALVGPLVENMDVLAGLIQDLDIETAVGVQLDIIGLWVGRSRGIDVPITGKFFTWDSEDPEEAWDVSAWLGPGENVTGIQLLSDGLYRLLLKAKISANHWKGDIPGAYYTLGEAFGHELVAAGHLTIADNQDMTMTVGHSPSINGLPLQMLLNGNILIKPAGVGVNYEEIEGPPPAELLPPFEMFMFKGGVPTTDEVLWQETIRGVNATLVDGDWIVCDSVVPFLAETTYQMLKNVVVFASVVFPAAGTIPFVTMIGGSVTLNDGDIFKLAVVGTDTTGAHITATIYGTQVLP